VCGWHQTRPGARSCRALVGAIGLWMTAWPVAAAWADDEAPEAPEAPEADEPESESDPESDDTPEVTESTDVRGHKKSAKNDAHRAAESMFVVELDDAIAPSASVADVLDHVPGASVRRLGGPGDPVFVSIRGSSFQQVAVYVDGVPLNAFGTLAVDLSELDLGGFDRIELYRGFAPPHLGASAIGGAVNLITDLDRDVAPRAQVGFGSFGTRQARVAAGRSADLSAGRAAWRASVGYLGTRGDYDVFSHNGTVYNRFDDRTLPRSNNASDLVSGRVSAVAEAGPVSFRLLHQAAWIDGGVPGAFYSETRETRASVAQNLLHGRLRADLDSRATLQAGVGWRYRWDRYLDLLGEVGVGNQDQRSHAHTITGDVSAALRPFPQLTLRPSARLNVDSYAPIELVGGRHEDGERRRVASQFALDATATPLPALELRGSIGLYLLDHRFLGTVPFSDEPIVSDGQELLVHPQPGFAVAVRPHDAITVRASVSRGVRAPTFLELFGDRGTVVGNAALRPEVGNQVDGGVRVRAEASGVVLGADVGGFYRDVDDLIAFVPNGQRVSAARNLGRVWTAGAELFGEVQVRDLVFGSVAATLQDNRIVDGAADTVGNRVPFVPTAQIDTTLGFGWGDRVRVSWSFHYTSKTWDSPSNLFAQAARPLHDLSLRVQPNPLFPWLAVDLRNLANTTTAADFRNPAVPRDDDRTVVALQDFRGQPLPGRSVMITLGWTAPDSLLETR